MNWHPKSESTVLSRKRVVCQLQVKNKMLPQVKEFNIFGSCSRVMGKRRVTVKGPKEKDRGYNSVNELLAKDEWALP